MELYLKITVGLFLLVQAFNLASLQYSTNPPRHTIDKSWLRELPKSKNGSRNTVVPGEGREHDHKADGAKELSNDDHSGIPSGSMAIFTEEEENVAHQNIGENEGEMNDITEPPDLLNATTKAPESPNAKTSPTNATKVSTNSSQANITVTEDELVNSTAIPQTSTIDLSAQNSTSGFLDDLDSPTTLAPVSNDTQESTIQPTEDTRSANSTESTNTSMTTSVIPKTTSTSLSTMEVYTSTITEISPETTTPAELNTPEMVNKTGKGSATGGGSERELDSHSQRNRSWVAVLGTIVVVGLVALVAYIIVKNKHQKGFSHRKLVEEYSGPDPVLRLENHDPLDLNFGRVAYYNPGMQGDNIQMTNFPGRH